MYGEGYLSSLDPGFHQIASPSPSASLLSLNEATSCSLPLQLDYLKVLLLPVGLPCQNLGWMCSQMLLLSTHSMEKRSPSRCFLTRFPPTVTFCGAAADGDKTGNIEAESDGGLDEVLPFEGMLTDRGNTVAGTGTGAGTETALRTSKCWPC